MGDDGGVDEVATEAPNPRERSFLIRASEPAVSDDVRDQDRRELSDLGHFLRHPALRRPSIMAGGLGVPASFTHLTVTRGIEAARFGEGGLRLVHLAGEGVGRRQVRVDEVARARPSRSPCEIRRSPRRNDRDQPRSCLRYRER